MPYEEVKIINSGDFTITSIIIILLSFFYYYYKYRNTRNNIENLNLNNNNASIPNINRNEFNPHIEEEIKQFEEKSINNESSRTAQSNSTDNCMDQTSKKLKIFTLINSIKKEHFINFDMIIDEFIKNNLSDVPLPNNNKLILICKGKKLDPKLQFNKYQVSDDTIIHGFFIKNEPSNNNSEDRSSDNMNQNNNVINGVNNPNSVSVYTIAIHCFILFFICTYLYLSKKFPDLFPKKNSLLFGFLSIFWLTQVSKTLAKLYIYRLIVYD